MDSKVCLVIRSGMAAKPRLDSSGGPVASPVLGSNAFDRRTSPNWLPWVAWGGTLLAAASMAVSQGADDEAELVEALAWFLGLLAIAGIGALGAGSRRATVPGWLLIGFAFLWALGEATYGWLASLASWVDLEAARWALAFADTSYTLALHSLLLALVMIPDGRLPSGRWRFVGPILLASAAVWTFLSILISRRIVDVATYVGRDVLSSFEGTELAPWMEPAVIYGQLVWGVLIIVLVAAVLVTRYRSAGHEERQQLKWVVTGGVAVILTFGLWMAQPEAGLVSRVQVSLPGVALLSLAAGFGSAFFRHRLWDIDVVVRRSLVYAVLWLAIAIVYVVVAGGLGLAAGARFPVEVAIFLTVLATLVFLPARHWLEAASDRWVFGQRAPAAEVITSFGESVVTSTGPEDVAAELADLMLRSARLGRVDVVLTGHDAVSVGEQVHGPVHTVELSWGQERFGHVRFQPRSGARIGAHDIALVEALSGQAGLALSHAGMAARIVRAQEDERRHLERDIHDGAQQQLAALIVRIGLMRSRSHEEAETADLAAIQSDARKVLVDLRELAQGIHPSVLRDGGLAAALEDRCARLPFLVELHVPDDLRTRRFGRDVEAAAYFFASEAIANSLKHSGSPSIDINLEMTDSELIVEVVDAGTGFDPAAIVNGSGIAGLSDRVRALGGHVELRSGPGQGAHLRARLPRDFTSETSR
jgi:signal transduction histidine kinase